jgi:hypothetical protein
VDGQTGSEYEEGLEENLRSLLDRFKSGTYKDPPVRRTYVPKDDGKQTRPIGIPTFEDKVLQRAVSMVLEAVYEQDFLACSYGYRPGRSAHHALEDLWQGLMRVGGAWVLEVDIKSFCRWRTANGPLSRGGVGQTAGFLLGRGRDGHPAGRQAGGSLGAEGEAITASSRHHYWARGRDCDRLRNRLRWDCLAAIPRPPITESARRSAAAAVLSRRATEKT